MPYALRLHAASVERVILDFGADLVAARRAHMMTQRDLHEASGVSQSAISMAENGLAEGMRLAQVARLAAALHSDLLIRACPHAPGAAVSPWNGRIARTEVYIADPVRQRLIDPRDYHPYISESAIRVLHRPSSVIGAPLPDALRRRASGEDATSADDLTPDGESGPG
jgi:transcriptional regulator with XRE-family HTH domain